MNRAHYSPHPTAPLPPDAHAWSRGDSTPAVDLTPAAILLVDDRPENLLALEAILSDLGVTLVRAASGEEALKRLLEQEFAAVLLDVQMPGMDGFETARLIRSRERCRHLPILFLTASERTDLDVLRGYASGGVDYLFKPVEPEFLKAKVWAFIELWKRTQALQLEIAARREAELALTRVHEKLEQRVAERTAALQQEIQEREAVAQALRESEAQLRQAAKMEAVGRLAGGIAHDFNNMLAVILGYSELLGLRSRPGDGWHEPLTQVRQAAERAARLTRQLLAFSRRQVIAPEVLDLNHVVASISPMLERVIGEDIVLETRLAPQAAYSFADPSQMEQVLLNLAVNARDALPGGGRLTIQVGETDLPGASGDEPTALPPGRYVQLVVRDTGCGMDADTRAHIFEPFFTTKASGEGTGLGLATVYGIVQQSGGDLRVDSAPGQGTTFTIWLPHAGTEAPPSGAETRSGKRLGGSETILLVEDEPLVRKYLFTALHGLGYSVIEAADGQEALRRATAHAGSVDLVLTDVVLPDQSGQTLAEELAVQLSGAKILFMSGYTDDAVVRRGVLRAETPFLQKPFTLPALAHKLRELLDADLELA